MGDWTFRGWTDKEKGSGGMAGKPRIRNAMLFALGLVALYLAFRYIVPLIAPFLFGLMIALLIEPIVKASDKYTRIPRSFVSFLTLLVLAGLFSFLLTITVSKIVSELDQLIRLLPRYEKDITRWATDQFVVLKGYYDRLPDPVMSAIDTSGQSVYDRLVAITKTVVNSIRAVPNLFITTLITILSAYFISRDKKTITELVLKVLPKPLEARYRTFKDHFLRTMGAYIRAQLILMLITTVISLVWLLTLKVRYAWILGLSLGLLDILPMLGPATLLVPWGIMGFFMGAKGIAIWLFALLGSLMVVRQLFESKVVGESIGVHPLVTLLSLYISVNLFGGTGFIIGPAIVIIGAAVSKSISGSPKKPIDAE